MLKPTPKRPTLTARQQEIYDFISDRIRVRGYGPTVREIGAQFGIRSPNGVMCHLKALEKKEMLKRAAHLSRGIELNPKYDRKLAFKDGLIELLNAGYRLELTQSEAGPYWARAYLQETCEAEASADELEEAVIELKRLMDGVCAKRNVGQLESQTELVAAC